MLFRKLVDWGIFFFGYIFSIPFIFSSKYLGWPIIKTKDVFDVWTFAHFYATLLIAFLLYSYHIHILVSSLIAFLIMYVYELVIDGNRLEDPEGFSISDIGADFISILVLLISYYGLHLIIK